MPTEYVDHQFVVMLHDPDNPGSSEPMEHVHVTAYDNMHGTGELKFEGFTGPDGFARDSDGNHPFLTPGTYFFFANKSGYSFSIAPQIVVGASQGTIEGTADG